MVHPKNKNPIPIDKRIVSVNNLSVNYENNEVIKNLSFQISKGEKAVITGESGKGKSTILNTLLGFVPISEGEIYFFNNKLTAENILKIRSRVAWLPQETALHFDTVNDIIYSLFNLKINKTKYPSKFEIDQILQNLNIPSTIPDKEIDEISGGQKQRILLAGALLLKKDILIMDEPTSDLDEKNKKSITDFILSQKDLTVITASHDAYWIERSSKIIAL